MTSSTTGPPGDLLTLGLFGSPRIERDGAPVSFDTRKAVALLAFLAVSNRPQRRDSLAALLWPEADQTRARGALRRTLSVAGTVGPALRVEREQVGLRSELVSCDVVHFRSLLAKGDAGSLREAVDLAHDTLLAGFSLRDSPTFEEWQTVAAERLRTDLIGGLQHLVELDLAAGRLDEALAHARRWVDTDPTSEPGNREVMRLLAWTGQRPAALRQYRRLVNLLDRELGVPPLPETEQVYDAIRADRLPAPEPTVGEAPSPSGNSRIVPPPATSIVGRDRELRRLTQAWEQAADQPAHVAVVGEPGLGRSSLVVELAVTVAAAGGPTVTVRGHEAESGLALTGVRDLLRGLTLPDPAADADRHAALARLEREPRSGHHDEPGGLATLCEQVLRLVRAAVATTPPGLLVVDDAQWLDASSDEVLAYVARRAPQGLLVVVTWRAGASTRSLAAVALELGTVVALGPLDLDGVRQLLAQVPGTRLLPEEVHQRTGGVPRLVVEHIAAAGLGEGDAASELRDIVVARLESASETARQVVSAVAVVGTAADPELVRAVSGRTEPETVDGLEEAVRLGLLVEVTDREGYDFPHELLRRVVLDRAGLARRRLLHSRTAQVLARRHSVPTSGVAAAVVAHHLSASGQDDLAATWHWNAAREFRALYAYREEVAQLDAARALGYDPAAVHSATGVAYTRMGRYREALTAFERAAAAATEPLQLAAVEHQLALVHDRLGDWVVAEAHLESAADLLSDHQGNPLSARVAADLALVLHRREQLERSEEAARRATQLAEASQDDVALAQAQDVLGMLALRQGRLDDALAQLAESRRTAARAQDLQLEVAAANNSARAYEAAGRYEEALAAAHEALALGTTLGDRHRLAALHTNLADLLHRHGDEQEARAQAKAAAEVFRDIDEATVRPQVWTLVEW